MGLNVATAKNEMCLYVFLRKNVHDILLSGEKKKKKEEEEKKQNMQFQNHFGNKILTQA